MADLPGALLLRLGRHAEERIDLAFVEELHRAGVRTLDPLDVVGGIEPDIGGHERTQHVRAGRQRRTRRPSCP